MKAMVAGALISQSVIAPVIAQPRPGGARPADEGDDIAKDSNTEINVKNAEIASIIRIFSRKLKRNYILDEKVRGKVSIYLPGKVSAEESLRILDSVLALKGFTSVPIGDNIWKIVPSKEARQSTIPTLTESRIEKATAAVVTRLVNLKYVNAQDIQQILSQLVSADGLVNAYTGTNSLILIDSEDNIERLVKLVDELDVPFSNREMTIIPIQYADAQDVAQKLADILGEGNRRDGNSDMARANIGDPAAAAAPPVPGGAQRVAMGGRTVAARGIEPKIIADQRTNSIIVVADGDTTARVRALIAQLDSKLDLSGNKFYVYRCQHANAEELAQVLSGLAGGGGAGSGTTGTTPGRLSGSSSSRSGLSGSQQRSSSQNQGAFGGAGTGGGGTGGGGAGGQQGPMSTQLGENINITADPATNSLIIAASKLDYERIRGLLAQIDVKRRQALVEATLLEVSIDHSIRTSTSFLGSTGGADGGGLIKSDFANTNSLNTLFTDPQKLQGLTLAAASAGSLTLPGGLTIPTQSVLMSAAQRNNNVNLLSAPTILATDNEEAQIVVGKNVPFLASTSTNATNLNNTFNQVDRQDVGITLRITPQISSRDYVTLKVFTEVSALDESTINSTLGPTTRKRQSETTIIAKDGQMIVTGGLISDDTGETDEGVPYLKDIPVLGHAFKANTQARLQQNLLIFLTPRIVKDQFDARDATIEGRDRLEDVIAAYDVNPSRKEVLENQRIDKVAESIPYEGPKPGTILPPQKYTEGVANKAVKAPKEKHVIVDDPSRGTLDLDAANGEGKSDVLDLDALPSSSSPRSSLKPGAVKSSASAQSAGTFVVVELARKEDAKKDLPFLVKGSHGIGGLMIPAESSEQARKFFAPRGDYVYLWNNQSIPVRIRSAYPSQEAAQLDYPRLGSWYSLSPYEIMNLGKGPWAKKGAR
jgi:general secretion pathway protein D